MVDTIINLIIKVIENFSNTNAGMMIYSCAVVCCSFGIVKRLWSRF